VLIGLVGSKRMVYSGIGVLSLRLAYLLTLLYLSFCCCYCRYIRSNTDFGCNTFEESFKLLTGLRNIWLARTFSTTFVLFWTMLNGDLGLLELLLLFFVVYGTFIGGAN